MNQESFDLDRWEILGGFVRISFGKWLARRQAEEWIMSLTTRGQKEDSNWKRTWVWVWVWVWVCVKRDSSPLLFTLQHSYIHSDLWFSGLLPCTGFLYLSLRSVQFSSVTQSCPTLCNPQAWQHARPPCPSPTPGVHPNPCPLSRWCHPTISSSVVPFSSYLQSFPASGSFPISQFFTSGGQNIGALASASVLPMNIQDWFPLGWTGWISLQSKGLSRVFSNTTVQKHQFFCTQLSL